MVTLRDLVDELLHAKVKTKLFGGEHSPKIGRLVIVDRIGAGAMGTVFAAYDPRLDRKVAVKVLRSSDDAARVLGEARALAKLTHPNVVAVHDADEVDGLVYIVMELASGVPLRTWAASSATSPVLARGATGLGDAEPGGSPDGRRCAPPDRLRSWRDIVRVMREAGAGIAAAHAAGLVHRDIKPENILVGDDRVRVVDFGLATARADDEGTSAGTPFYMAPEVLAGGTATAASDQFSFAVTLYEVLYGQRPHALASGVAATLPASAATQSRRELVADLRDAAAKAAASKPSSASPVPAWVHAVVARGLAADPRERFASMAELVAALGRDRRRRMRVVAIASATLVAGAAIGAFAYRSQASGSDACTGGPARVAPVWNDAVKAKVRTALANAPWSTQTLTLLDEHASTWQLSYRRVCEASRAGEQSGALLDLRMRCLDRALARFGALTGALTTGALDAQTRVAAPTAIEELDTSTRCESLADASELAMPSDPRERAKVVAAERELDRAWAAFVLGRYQGARTIVAAIDANQPVPRVKAEILSLASAIEARIGDGAAARARLDEALVAAADAKAPELELDIWSRRLRNELFAGDPAKVVEWATFARAAAKRAGREGADIEGIVAQALRNAGKLEEARTLLDKALASKDPLRPDQRALLEMNRGSIDLALGDSKSALTLFQQARDRVLAALGDHHPDLAIYEDKLAAAKRARGLMREALKLHDHSLALRIEAFGADDRAVATGLLYRAQSRLEVGELQAARDDLQRARAIREKAFGETSPRVAEILVALGDVLAALGEPQSAAGLYDDAAKLDARLDLAARRHAIGQALALDARRHAVGQTLALDARRNAVGQTLELDAIPPLGDHEPLSVDRAIALAARVELLVAAKRKDEALALAAALRARYRPELDPALGAAVAQALLAAGDRAGAAEVFTRAAATLSNEPTRTALKIFVGLARTSDAQAPAAARAAIATYQALPHLARGPEYDAMWELSRTIPH